MFRDAGGSNVVGVRVPTNPGQSTLVVNVSGMDGVAGVNGFHMAGVRTLADGFRLISYIGDPDQPKNLVFWSRR